MLSIVVENFKRSGIVIDRSRYLYEVENNLLIVIENFFSDRDRDLF